MPIYFLSSNNGLDQSRELETRIKSVVPDLVRIGNLKEIAANVRTNPGDSAIILFEAPTNDRQYLDNLIGVVARNREAIFFIVISDDISASDYKRLVQTGSADWVSRAGAPQEILDILNKRNRAAPHAETGKAGVPVIIPFIPSAGGVGNSKLATEVGVWLKTDKATKNKRICLIDLDFQTSHVCSYLDIEPRLRIGEIAENPERLDEQLFEILKSHHSSGLDVMAAPRGKFDLAAIGIDALDALFDMVSQHYDLVLIDLPVTWLKWTVDIIANSDALVVTGINTIPCLHQIAETLAVARASRADAVPIAVVINRCERAFLGGIARQKHVERVLAREKTFFIGNYAAAMVASVNTGVPLVAAYGDRKASKQIAALARYCAEVKSVRLADKTTIG